jgi:hypothetical protein
MSERLSRLARLQRGSNSFPGAPNAAPSPADANTAARCPHRHLLAELSDAAYNTVQSFHSDSAVSFSIFLNHLPDMCCQQPPDVLLRAMQVGACAQRLGRRRRRRPKRQQQAAAGLCHVACARPCPLWPPLSPLLTMLPPPPPPTPSPTGHCRHHHAHPAGPRRGRYLAPQLCRVGRHYDGRDAVRVAQQRRRGDALLRRRCGAQGGGKLGGSPWAAGAGE